MLLASNWKGFPTHQSTTSLNFNVQNNAKVIRVRFGRLPKTIGHTWWSDDEHSHNQYILTIQVFKCWYWVGCWFSTFTLYVWACACVSWMWWIFRKILLAPHNTATGLNNVMWKKPFFDCQNKTQHQHVAKIPTTKVKPCFKENHSTDNLELTCSPSTLT